MMYRPAALFGLLLALFPSTLWAQCTTPWKVLHYTETTGYNHNTKSQSLSMFNSWAAANNYSVTTDDNGSQFNTLANLQQYAVVVFSNTSGDNGLDATQRANFEAYIAAGGSYLGIHAATDTYRHSTANGGSKGKWDWYAETVAGATVQQNPNHTNQNHNNTMTQQQPGHPTLANVPSPWNKTEEYYYWQNGYLNSTFTELLRVGQTGGNSYDAPRMMAHCKNLSGGGRAFYTALGHSGNNYTGDVNFQNLIRDALLWCAEPNICPGGGSVTITGTTTADVCDNGLGAVNITVSGGSSPYSFSWSNGATSEDLTGVNAGTYSVTVTDNTGATATTSFTVANNPGSLSISFSEIKPITCPGGSDGEIEASASGGTSPYNYIWSNGPLTAQNAGIGAGTYTVYVSDDNGCADTASYTFSGPNPWNLNVTETTPISCAGDSDGKLTAVVNGANGGYSFLWSTGSTSQTATGLSQGTYSVTITDAQGCTTSGSGSISDPAAISVALTATDETCAGADDGSVTSSVSGGAGGYSYAWSNGGSGTSISGVADGTYSLTVTDANGCTGSGSATVNAPDTLLASVAITQAIACGGSNGELTASATGGSSPYTFLWTGGSNNQILTGLSAGNYIVLVTDGNGCQDTASATLSAPAGFTVTLSTDGTILCAGDSAVGIKAGVTGGTSPFTYLWNTGATTDSIGSLPAGSYSVTVTDANGCTGTASTTVSGPSPLVASASVLANVTCFNGTDGSVQASAAGGTGPYNYAWIGGPASNSWTSAPAGTWQVVVTDANGCMDTASVSVSQPTQVVGAIQVLSTVKCVGGNGGALLASSSGGTGGFSFIWTDGPTASSRTVLVAGTYTVYVTDGSGCADTVSQTLADGSPVFVTITETTPVSCFGQTDGALLATATATTGTVIYQWNTGASGATLSNVGAGTYIVSITDANGCMASDTLVVSAPAGVTATASLVNNVTCFGGSDGAASGSASGGTSPYGFTWSDGQSGPSAINLPAGTVVLTVTDANGCADTSSVPISAPADLGVSIAETGSISCFGGSDGELSASVTAGVGTISYNWSSGGINAVESGLIAGTYTVIATDQNGCADTATFTLSEPADLTVSLSETNAISCFGGNDGEITATVSGGTGALTFNWSNGQTVNPATGLTAGSYQLIVQDANGCADTSSLSISAPTDISSSISVLTAISCFGGNNGELQVTASGGTGPYSYLWSNGSVADTASGLLAGGHQVIITDANGCQDTATFTLTEPAAISINAQVDNQVSCSGGNNGAASATASGGTSPLTFAWSNGQTGQSATGLGPGIYTVVVTDANGCQDSVSVNVTAPNAVQASISLVSGISCFGGNDGSLLAAATGGSGSYSYLWSNGQTTPANNNLTAGSWYVVVSDTAGCSDSAFFTLSAPAALSTIITELNGISCSGGSDGILQATVSGGTGPYGYLWSNGSTIPGAGGLSAGTHQVIVTDGNGCTDTTTYTLTDPTPVSVSISQTAVISCFGGTDGELTANATGGTGSYTYFWSNGSTGAVDSGLGAGTYSVIIADGNGCADTAYFTLTGPAALNVSATATQQVSCYNGSDGAAIATASGGAGGFSYLWSNGQAAAAATGLAAGGYTVVVTDANGCQDSSVVTISQPADIAASISQTATLSCFGDSSAALLASASGGSGPLTYTWSTGATGAAISGLPAGTYTVYAADTSGCVDSASFVITAPASVVASISPTQLISCFGGNNGILTASATGGNNVYTYLWGGGQTSPSLNGLTSGTYQVMVTDGNGCMDSATYTLTDPAQLQTTISVVTPISCFGTATGVLNAGSTGGTGAVAFTWSNGQAGSVASGLVAGTYIVTATDANGCTAKDTFQLSQPAPFTASAAQLAPATCNAAGDGSAVVTVSGGTGPFTYLWSNGQTTDTLQNVGPGSYSVVVTGAGGCTASASVNVSNFLPWSAAAVVVNDVTCFGGNDGTMTVSVTNGGGFGPFTYNWSNGQSTDTATNLTAGVYTLTLTDAGGCVQLVSDTIAQPAAITISLQNQTNVSCFGGNNGSLTVAASGGTGPLSFSWDNGGSTANISGLTAQTYILTVTDSVGCTAKDTFVISQPAALTASLTATPISCFGANDGQISAGVSGGTSPLTYAWSNGGTSSTITNLAAGTYSLVATDGNGCTITDSATVTEPAQIVAVAALVNDVTCFGGNDGAVSASATGGDGNFSYSWSNGASTAAASGLAAGSYIVTATDGNGCQDTDTVAVSQPADIVVSATVANNSTCFGAASGKAYVTASGGTGTLSFLWSNGATTDTISGVAAGTYTVVVTDSLGCQDSANVTISQPSSMVVSIPATTNITCNGGSNGAATAVASGGTGPYTYLWTSGQTTPTASGLTAGTWQVTATDASGCTANASVTLTQPDSLVVTPAIANPISCFGAADGQLTATLTGGTAPYSVFWSNGQIGVTASNLPAGTYIAIAGDANGCLDTGSVTLVQPAAVVGSMTILQNVNCFGGNDAIASVSATGGSGTFTYAWDNGITGPVDSFLTAGMHEVVITDGNGCTDTVSFTITQPADLLVNASVLTNVSCFGGNNGVAVASASGGASPYAYLWSNGQSGPGASGLGAGPVTVVVTDADGCVDSASTTISEPASMNLSLSVTDVSCFGTSDGTASVTVGGGTSPFTYLWSVAGNTASLSGLAAGIVSVTVTDANGCQETVTDTIAQPLPVVASISVTNPISCFGGSDGALQASMAGGTPPSSYLWSNGQTGVTTSGLTAGSYSVIITDANGCADTAQTTLSQPADIVTTLQTNTAVSCFGGNDGSASVNATGGAGTLSYLWSNGQTGPAATGLIAGTYQVIVSDQNGCSDTTSVTISSPTDLLVSASVTTTITCFGGNNGVATGTASGGTGPYTYLWSNGQTTTAASGLSAGTYTLVVTDANGCQDSASVTLAQPSSISLTVSQVAPVSCFGGNDGSALVVASGGAGPYTYLWSSGQTSVLASGLSSGMVSVTVTDSKGCQATDSVMITEPQPLVAAISLTASPSCPGNANGSLTGSATGGNGSFVYAWSNGQNGPTASGLVAGTYTLTVTDSKGCQDTAQYILPNPPAISVTASQLAPVSCFGGNDGQATVIATGGAGGFTYSWTGGQTGATASGLPAGIVTVTATDANGCQATDTALISQPTQLLASASMTGQTTCLGAADGTASASATGGTAPYTFAWDNGQTGTSATNLTAGAHTVIVTDANGCSDTASVTITQPSTMALSFQELQPITCVGNTDGVIQATATGGTPGYTYQWTNGPAAQTWSGIGVGTYVMTASDANGCLVVDSVTVTAPSLLNAAIDLLAAVTCPGGTDGEMEAIVTGGNSPYGYLWSNGGTTANISGLSAGTYSVVVTDANGCSVNASATLQTPVGVQANIQILDSVNCHGASDATLIGSGSSGLAPYQFSWSTGSTNATLANIPAGTYELIVTDAFGCKDTNEVFLPDPDTLIFSTAILTPLTCANVNDGVLVATASGGTAPLSIYWDNVASVDTLKGAGPGQYIGVVVDVKGCSVSDTLDLVAPPAIQITTNSLINVSCSGTNDGSIDVSISGGTGALTATWSHGPTGTTVTGLSAGTYILTVTDANGCTVSDTFQITQASPLLTSITTSQGISCFGDQTGELAVQVNGGQAPYSVLWSNGSTFPAISNLPADTYSAVVSDGNGCSDTAFATITEPDTLIATISVTTPLLCAGDQNGALAVDVQGGTPGYTFTWTGGLSGSTPTGVGPGNYSLIVTDVSGCTDTASVSLVDPAPIVINTASVTNVSCFGANDGSIDVSISGGTGTLTASWNNGATGSSLSALAAGTYILTVTDANGCAESDTFQISEPAQLLTSITTIQGISCFGDQTGELAVQVNGGQAPYSVLWSNGSTFPAIANLPAGTYSAVVSDGNGCTDTAFATITEPDTLIATISVTTPLLCAGDQNGALAVAVQGGTPGYTFSWTGGLSGGTPSGIGPGNYSLTVTDASGCSDTASVVFTDPLPIQISLLSQTNVNCFGGNDGNIQVAVSGGTGTLTTSWDNGATGTSLSGLVAGTYILTVTDANGCTKLDTFQITQPAQLVTTIDINQGIGCASAQMGQLSAQVTGGVAPISLLWNSGATTKTISNLSAGTYSVLVTDGNGCTDSAQVILTAPDSLEATIAIVSPVLCAGDSSGVFSVAVQGGTPGYTYSWTGGLSGSTPTGIGAGNYALTVTDVSGCTDTASVSLVDPAPIVINTISVADVSCFGANDGSIDVSFSGGTGTLTASWDNGATGSSLSGLTAGTYILSVTDANGCAMSDTFKINEPAPLVTSIVTIQGISCFGDQTGELAVQVNGGQAPYSVLWSNGSTFPAIANLPAGTYSAVVSDGNGCTDTAFATITEPDTLIATISVTTPLLCAGDQNGALAVAVQGGTPGYTFSWTGGLGGGTPSGIGPGNYSLTVTDASGCSDTASVVFTDPLPIQISLLSQTNVNCFGGNDGSIQVTVSGGTGTLTTSWDNGATGTSLNGLAAGTYILSVTDANGCTKLDTFQITQPAQLVTTIDINQGIGCASAQMGQLSAQVTGGVAPISLLWNTGATTKTISNLSAGAYSVLVTDGNGCTDSAQIILTAPDSLEATIAIVSPVLCAGDSSGAVIVNATGGTPGFTYSWTGGLAGSAPSGIPAGTYQLTVTDLSGCSDTASVTLAEPDPILISLIGQTDVSCFNGADGSIQVAVSGGTGTLTTTWSNGNTGTSVSGLSAGTYLVTTTDANGCAVSDTFKINEPAPLVASIVTIQGISCFGDQTGELAVQVNGGTPTYAVLWSNGATFPAISNLQAGTYSAIVSDGNGCADTAFATLTEPDTLIASISVTSPIQCAGDQNGALSVGVSGGTPGYTYTWTGGLGGSAPTNVGAGNYQLTVTDVSGCTDTASVTLVDPAPIVISTVSIADVSCFGANDGSINVTISGGTGTLTANWDNGATGTSLSGLAAGTYILTVTDANGCFAKDTFLISEPLALVSSIVVNQGISCFGDQTGQLSVQVNGGTPTYTVLWSTGNTSPTISNLPQGTYSAVVTDGNGCTDTSTVVLTQPDSLIASITITAPILCAGDLNGALSVDVQGGSPGYNYTWTGGLSGSSPTGIGAGTYQVTVTDQSGCSDTASVTLQSPAPLLVSTTVSQPITCPGQTNGAATATISGGTTPYSVLWSDGQTTPTATNLTAGTYSVFVTDFNGCTDTQTVTLITPPPLQTTITIQQEISCFGDQNGILSVSASGGTASYTYLWSTGQTGTVINQLGAGTYQVQVTDGNGCLDTATLVFSEPDSLIVLPQLVQPIICGGANDAILAGNASGGTPGFTFTWTPGGILDTLTNVGPGTYQLLVTDSHGCTAGDSIVVTEPDTVVLTAEVLADVTCFGGADGEAEVSAAGGVIPYTWTWNDGPTGPTRTGLTAGTYTAVFTDSLGCVDSISVTISEPAAMELSLTELTPASCDSATNGSATVDIAGGTAPFSYAWSNLETTDTAFSLLPGWQLVQVTDSLGCSATDSIEIGISRPWSAEVVLLDTVSCFGGNDGSAEIVLSGLTSGLTILWENGETTNPAVGLEGDTTYVTITDVFGCDTTAFVVVPEPQPMIVLGTAANTDRGLSNGAIRIDSVVNGEGPFSFLWTNNATGSIISGLDTGLYQVIVTDVNGCEGTGSFEIGENVLEWTPIMADVDCELGVVRVNWTVNEEAGVEFYSLERSEDGLLYSRVGERNSLGDTLGQRLYTLVDTLTPESELLYRVRAHFFNGSVVASEPVRIFPCVTDSGYVAVYPVPAVQGEQITAVFQTRFLRETRIELRNALHQTLQYYDIPEPRGRQMVIFETEELAGGHYYVVVSNSGEAYSTRVLVVE